MNNDDKGYVVIDNGTGLIKAGFGGEDNPHSVFPSAFGTFYKEPTPPTAAAEDIAAAEQKDAEKKEDNNSDKDDESDKEKENKDKEEKEKEPELQKIFYVGHEAVNKCDKDDIKWPMKYGIIDDWDTMELIWNHTFNNELRVDPEEHGVIMTEPSNNPRQNREKMIQIMFEKFKVPSYFSANTAILSLYAKGSYVLFVVLLLLLLL